MDKQIQDIWSDLHQELKNFIFSKVGDRDDCEDILQDVFLKIQLNLHTLSDCSRLTSWVYQITRNTVADHYRKTGRELQTDTSGLAEQESEEPLYLPLSRCINQKIGKLSEKYRQAILFTYFNEYSQLTLAKELNLSYSGAKTRVQRGKEILKNNILDCPRVKSDKNGKIIDFE